MIIKTDESFAALVLELGGGETMWCNCPPRGTEPGLGPGNGVVTLHAGNCHTLTRHESHGVKLSQVTVRHVHVHIVTLLNCFF